MSEYARCVLSGDPPPLTNEQREIQEYVADTGHDVYELLTTIELESGASAELLRCTICGEESVDE